jgi:hypothetical protein
MNPNGHRLAVDTTDERRATTGRAILQASGLVMRDSAVNKQKKK